MCRGANGSALLTIIFDLDFKSTRLTKSETLVRLGKLMSQKGRPLVSLWVQTSSQRSFAEAGMTMKRTRKLACRSMV
jgi:hypothetical protein